MSHGIATPKDVSKATTDDVAGRNTDKSERATGSRAFPAKIGLGVLAALTAPAGLLVVDDASRIEKAEAVGEPIPITNVAEGFLLGYDVTTESGEVLYVPRNAAVFTEGPPDGSGGNEENGVTNTITRVSVSNKPNPVVSQVVPGLPQNISLLDLILGTHKGSQAIKYEIRFNEPIEPANTNPDTAKNTARITADQPTVANRPDKKTDPSSGTN
jgi:hypothetical protein